MLRRNQYGCWCALQRVRGGGVDWWCGLVVVWIADLTHHCRLVVCIAPIKSAVQPPLLQPPLSHIATAVLARTDSSSGVVCGGGMRLVSGGGIEDVLGLEAR